MGFLTKLKGDLMGMLTLICLGNMISSTVTTIWDLDPSLG